MNGTFVVQRSAIPVRGGSENLHSGDNWIAGLTAAMLAANRKQNEQAPPPEHRPAFKAKVALAAVKARRR